MNNTIVVISTSGQEYQLPGLTWTPEQVVSTYSASVPGIGSMTPEVTTDANGDKRITFRPRTGTKG
jgi:hypothetical protein